MSMLWLVSGIYPTVKVVEVERKNKELVVKKGVVLA